MGRYWNEPDWDPDPNWDLDPDDEIGETWESADDEMFDTYGHKDVMSVTHDLTDEELRRFVNFDVFYDPMPMFGFISQWVWFLAVLAVLGALGGFAAFRSRTALVFGGLLTPIVMLRVMESATERRRQQARQLGLCDGRIVSVSPRGIAVRIPYAEETSMAGIGPLTRPWSGIRKVSTSDEDIVFWMRPAAGDLEGRARIVVPLRAFSSAAEAAAFENTARRWHADAGGENAWLGEDEEL
jgi:hypothetical protein